MQLGSWSRNIFKELKTKKDVKMLEILKQTKFEGIS